MLQSRRNLLKTSSAILMAALLPYKAFAQATSDTVKRGGILKNSVDFQLKSIDPIVGGAAAADRLVYYQFYDSLLRVGPTGLLEPGLAENWAVSDDKLTVTMKLRQGVMFHDSEPFNAEAAAFNLNRLLDPNLDASAIGHANDLKGVVSVTASGDYDLEIKLDAPSGPLLANLAVEAGMMCSPKAIADYGDDYGANPVGTGPFKFKEWIRDSHVSGVKNENYWRAGVDGEALPYLDGFETRFISINATKIVELESGGLHLVDTLTARDGKSLEGKDGIYLIEAPQAQLSWLNFATQKAPFDNVDVRRAFVCAIDKQGLLNAISLGVGFVPPFWFAKSEWAFSDTPAPDSYNPELAREYLEKSGVALPLKVKMNVIQRDPDAQIAQLVQGQLAEIGVEAEINIMERQAWLAAYKSGEHEFGIGRFPIPFLDPHQVCSVIIGPGAGANFSNVDDPELAQWVTDARVETDQGKRKEIYNKIQARCVDEAYMSMLLARGVLYAARTDISGIVLDPNGSWFLEGAFLTA